MTDMEKTADNNAYVIIPSEVAGLIMEKLKIAQNMAHFHYEHMETAYEYAIKRFRDTAECFEGSHNKPNTKKAFNN